LKPPDFNPWNLKCDITVSSLCFFKYNLYRYAKDIDGMVLALPRATRNFAVDGFVPKPH
jgi:hypothetical protein